MKARSRLNVPNGNLLSREWCVLLASSGPNHTLRDSSAGKTPNRKAVDQEYIPSVGIVSVFLELLKAIVQISKIVNSLLQTCAGLPIERRNDAPRYIHTQPSHHDHDFFPLASSLFSSFPTALTQTPLPFAPLTSDSKNSAIFFSFRPSP